MACLYVSIPQAVSTIAIRQLQIGEKVAVPVSIPQAVSTIAILTAFTIYDPTNDVGFQYRKR